IEGMPAGMPLLKEQIDESLLRRQKGHGRGRRMQIEKDIVEITSGVRHGYTLGSPISLVVNNDDFKRWERIMGEAPIDEDEEVRSVVARMGESHADLDGDLKDGHRDMRNVVVRYSAREITERVAAGDLAKTLI